MLAAPAIAGQVQTQSWHSQSAEEVLAQTGTSTQGMSSQEAAKRLAANGASAADA